MKLKLTRPRIIVIGVAAAVLAISMTSLASGVSLSKLVKKEVSKQISKATGPAGPAGANGANGFTGRVEVNTSAPYNNTDFKTATTATCPAGKVAIGGGAIVTSDTDTSPIAFKRSGPTSSGANNWLASAYETAATADSWNIQVSLYCANP